MIRLANKFDLDACVEMMRRYAEESPIAKLGQGCNHDSDYVKQFLFSLIAGRGFIYIDDNMKGMIAAIVVPNVWCPGVNEVKELAWWVGPKHRNGMIGGRLFVAFKRHAEQLIEEGRAHIITCSLMENSPKIDLHGFKKIETTYCKE